MLPKLFRRTAIKPLLSGAVVLFVVELLKDRFFGLLNKTMDKTWTEPIEALVGDRWYFALLISLAVRGSPTETPAMGDWG